MPDDYGRGAGKYNVRLCIEQNSPATDTAGQRISAWHPWIYRWAQVIPRGGAEKRTFDQLRPEVDVLVRMRFDSDTKTINPGAYRLHIGGELVQGLLSGGTVLNIDSVIDTDMRRVERELRCTEVTKTNY